MTLDEIRSAVEAGEAADAVIVGTKTQVEELVRGIPMRKSGPALGSNQLWGVPVVTIENWVGPLRVLTGAQAKAFREASGGLDKRSNPDWRLKT